MSKTQAETPQTQAQEIVESQELVPVSLGNGFIAEKTLTNAEAAQALAILAKVSAYTGAKAHPADEFLGQVVSIVGAITQPVNIGREVGVDKETGEVIKAYTPAVRTILKMENGEVISLVSKAAESFVNTFLFPLFGKGDFSCPVKLRITQISKGAGRTFNFQIVA